jgi:hypothetical protein
LTLELERIIEKAVQGNPADRFRSTQEFRDALAAAVGEREGHMPPVEPGELTVGRDREVGLLEAALRRTVGGGASFCWISGPLGMGKSRLLTEARWRAQILGLSVIDLRFLPETGSPPAEQQIAHGLRGSPKAAGAWLSALASERGGSSAERARRAAASYFAGPGPSLVLLVDDLEHADRESRHLLEELIRRCERSPGVGSGSW